MITYRLGDALPVDVAQRRANELSDETDPAYRHRIEAYLDAGHGCCALQNPEFAKMIIDNWRQFDGKRYHLHAWVVMPNHVHVLMQLSGSTSLAKIVQSWKSYTGRRLPVAWQREYWDRYIRDERHYQTAVAYIRDNPVKAGLSHHHDEWPWTSPSLGGSSTSSTASTKVEPALDPPGIGSKYRTVLQSEEELAAELERRHVLDVQGNGDGDE